MEEEQFFSSLVSTDLGESAGEMWFAGASERGGGGGEALVS